MKTKKNVKAQRLYVVSNAKLFQMKHEGAQPIFVLPADAASYDAMVEQAHAAIASDSDYQSIAHHQWLDLVDTVFAAVGITRPKEDKP